MQRKTLLRADGAQPRPEGLSVFRWHDLRPPSRFAGKVYGYGQ
jgi:hypothetical protein